MTDYEKQVLRYAALDVYKAIKILGQIDHSLGYIDSPYSSVIEGCRTVLFAISDDMYKHSAEERAE